MTLVELQELFSLFIHLTYLFGRNFIKRMKIVRKKMLECEVDFSFSDKPETNSCEATYPEKFMLSLKFTVDEHKNIFRHSIEL